MSRHLRYFTAPLLALCATVALAADLTHLLPQESVLTVGVEGLAAHEGKLKVFTDEWERLDLTRLLTAALGDEAEEVAADLPASLEGLTILDVLGGEAWLSVSVASFNPLPAITIVARLTPAGAAAAREAFAEAEGDITTFTEGSLTFDVVAPSTPIDSSDPFEAAFSVFAYSQFDDIVVISSNPDVLRGALRRYQGASEPSLVNNAGFAASVGQLGAGNAYFHIDLPAIIRTVAPFGAGMGFDNVIARLSAAFDVAGVAGSVTSLTNDGVAGRTLRALGDPSADPRVHALLAQPGVVTDGAMAFVSPNTVSYSVSTFDLPGWWDWLNALIAGSPELGIDDLSGMLNEMVGVDVDRLLFGWMGTEVASISSGSGPTPEVGMALENPLGDAVFAIATRDQTAAEAGVSELFMMATMLLTGFTSPDGMGSPTGPSVRNIAGVEVTEYSAGDLFTISTAFVDGYALIATTPAAMDDALFARQQRLGFSGSLATLRTLVPNGVTGYSISDDSAAIRTLSQSIVAELSLLVGFAPGGVDFDAADDAGAALATYLEFVADRMLGSYSYSHVEGTSVRGTSHMGIAW